MLSNNVVLAEAILLSMIPLLPVGQAVNEDEPRPAEPAALPPRPQPAVPAPAGPIPDTAIYWLAGLGTPLGISGIEGVRRLGEIAEISGGIGIGFAALFDQYHAPRPDQVLQWTVMPRLRLGGDRKAFTAGAGISGGNFGSLAFCLTCTNDTGVSYFLWSNLEIGLEFWGESGFAKRIFVGYAHGWCVSEGCVSAPTNLPYFGFGLGYAF